MRYVVAFDIVNDRARYRAVKVLLAYAHRVQKSVFEGVLSKETVRELREKLQSTVNLKEDSVRFYPLCAQCEEKIDIAGIGTVPGERKYIII